MYMLYDAGPISCSRKSTKRRRKEEKTLKKKLKVENQMFQILGEVSV